MTGTKRADITSQDDEISSTNCDLILKASSLLYPLIVKELSDQTTKKFNKEQWTLQELDNWVLSELPEKLETMQTETLHLDKDELVSLMDWKLAKGKFRPTLPKLIASNTSTQVQEATTEGFKIFMQLVKDPWPLDDYKLTLRNSMKALCVLKGVGPATASLLLSLLHKVTDWAPPFFSDEAFMYCYRDVARPLLPIKYTVKEYVEEFVPVLYNVCSKPWGPIERGAWSLKMYQQHRLDSLADIKLPFEVTEDGLNGMKTHIKSEGMALSHKKPKTKVNS